MLSKKMINVLAGIYNKAPQQSLTCMLGIPIVGVAYTPPVEPYRSIILSLAPFIIGLVVAWLTLHGIRLKSMCDVLSLQYYNNFFRPIYQQASDDNNEEVPYPLHVKFTDGGALTEGRHPLRKMMLVIPGVISNKDGMALQSKNFTVSLKNHRFNKTSCCNTECPNKETCPRTEGQHILEGAVVCKDRPRSTMVCVDKSSDQPGLTIIDYATIFSGVCTSIETVYGEGKATLELQKRALNFCKEKLESEIRKNDATFSRQVSVEVLTQDELWDRMAATDSI